MSYLRYDAGSREVIDAQKIEIDGAGGGDLSRRDVGLPT